MEALSSFKTQPKTKEKSVSEEDTKMKNKEWKQRKQIGGEMTHGRVSTSQTLIYSLLPPPSQSIIVF